MIIRWQNHRLIRMWMHRRCHRCLYINAVGAVWFMVWMALCFAFTVTKIGWEGRQKWKVSPCWWFIIRWTICYIRAIYSYCFWSNVIWRFGSIMILGFVNHSNCVVFFGVILQTRVSMIPFCRVTNRGIFILTHSSLNGAACKIVKWLWNLGL